MQLLQAGQRFSFNYTAEDQNASLFIAFQVYDVSSGTPVFSSQVVGTYSANGMYTGSLVAVANKSYLVLGFSYTDNSHATVDTSRAPSTAEFQVISGPITYLFFSYAAIDLNSSLNVRGSVYNVTTGSPVFVSNPSMTLVEHGSYFGSFTAIQGNTYNILGIVYTDNTFATPDTDYAPGSDEFDSITTTVSLFVTGQAHLIGQSQGQSGVVTVNPPIHFTQGDNAILSLIAVDALGNPINLTGATFSTMIQGANSVGPITFGNSQHTIDADQINFTGYFTLTLAQADTTNCGTGEHKEILTEITIGGSSVDFRGFNALQVYAPTPFE